MTCRDTVRRLMDYVDDRLDRTTRRALERHLDECPPCRGFLESYRATPDIVRRATRIRRSAGTTRRGA